MQSVEGVVEPESGDDIPIKMLDCDSITQAKEKVIDTLYKNCPASKRPQLTEVDLSKLTQRHQHYCTVYSRKILREKSFIDFVV